MNDFIEVYPQAFTKEYCEEVILTFNKMDESGLSRNRQAHEGAPKLNKDDSNVFFQDDFKESSFNFDSSKLMLSFNELFWGTYYRQYADKYAMLNDCESHGSYNVKVQKTKIGQGYHQWHCESTRRLTSNRILAWAVYLNDVEEGGETEFLYQHKRLKPEQGTLTIFPAAFTHTHRGNPPLSNDKYIITGWVEY